MPELKQSNKNFLIVSIGGEDERIHVSTTLDSRNCVPLCSPRWDKPELPMTPTSYSDASYMGYDGVYGLILSSFGGATCPECKEKLKEIGAVAPKGQPIRYFLLIQGDKQKTVHAPHTISAQMDCDGRPRFNHLQYSMCNARFELYKQRRNLNYSCILKRGTLEEVTCPVCIHMLKDEKLLEEKEEDSGNHS